MVQILFANAAIVEHSSFDFSPNAVHRRLQQRGSIPEGPAEPSVNRADLRIALAPKQDRMKVTVSCSCVKLHLDVGVQSVDVYP